MRRYGDDVWRPSPGLRASYLLIAAAFLVGTTWLYLGGDVLSLRDKVMFSVADLSAVSLLPLILFRWRLVLDRDELSFVFVRVRRLAVRDIVDAKCVAKEGLVFVCSDGTTESFGALGNTAWGHRRTSPTRSDLVARKVLCAAATARGDVPPSDFRLGPLRGVKRAAVEGGIAAFVLGLILGE